MAATNIASIEEWQALLKKGGNAILTISAEWDKKSQYYIPVFHNESEQWKNVDFYIMDSDNKQIFPLLSMLNIKKLPTTVYIEDGTVRAKNNLTRPAMFVDNIRKYLPHAIHK